MPAFDCDSLSRSSSAMFFKLGADAYNRKLDDRAAADRDVEALLDRYIVDDRGLALDRAKRLFARCIKNSHSPLAGSAVWFGAVRCLHKRVPEFDLATKLDVLGGGVELEDIWKSVCEPARAASRLDSAVFERYANAPALSFFRSLDFRSVVALGVCETCSAQEVRLLHALCTHPAFAAVAAMMEGELDAGFSDAMGDESASECGTPRSSEAESGVLADDELSDTDTSNLNLATREGSASPDADDRPAKLEQILLGLGLDKRVGQAFRLRLDEASAEAPLQTEGAGADANGEGVDDAVEAVALEYVGWLAQTRLSDVEGQDLDGLLDILRNPQGAAMFQAWEARLKRIVLAFSGLLATGVVERSRKRMRDDATDCSREVP